MAYVKFCFLLLCVNLVLCEDVCLESNPCRCVLRKDSKVIDLSSVGYPDRPRFYEVPVENCTELYSYNPCFPFESPDKYAKVADGLLPCAEASACIRTPGGSDGSPPEEHALGLQSSAVFGLNGSNYYINYTAKGSRQLQVHLICDVASTKPKLSIVTPDCAHNETIVLSLTTKCACPGECQSALPPPESSGLSTGSKLLIAFFTILLAYFLIGIVWNYCNGSHGMELVPNIEFWNDLPTLIMEGVTFTCSCCAKPSSYGAV